MNLLEITDRGAQRLLKRLVEKDVVEKIGTGRNTRYRLMK
jgi:predicted transcriptional regulator